MKFGLIIFFPIILYAECSMFIHHVEYGEFGRSCHSISSSYADSIYNGLERKRSRHKWYRHQVPDSLCHELLDVDFGMVSDSFFCPRIMGMLKYNEKNYFIHRFSYFYSDDKRIIPIKGVEKLKEYLMTIEYFRKNYREEREPASAFSSH